MHRRTKRSRVKNRLVVSMFCLPSVYFPTCRSCSVDPKVPEICRRLWTLFGYKSVRIFVGTTNVFGEVMVDALQECETRQLQVPSLRSPGDIFSVGARSADPAAESGFSRRPANAILPSNLNALSKKNERNSNRVQPVRYGCTHMRAVAHCLASTRARRTRCAVREPASGVGGPGRGRARTCVDARGRRTNQVEPIP